MVMWNGSSLWRKQFGAPNASLCTSCRNKTAAAEDRRKGVLADYLPARLLESKAGLRIIESYLGAFQPAEERLCPPLLRGLPHVSNAAHLCDRPGLRLSKAKRRYTTLATTVLCK